MSRAFVFPGQAGEIGENWTWLLEYGAAKSVIQGAQEVLGYNIFERSLLELSATQYGQLYVLVYSLACEAILRGHGFSPSVFGGHSLGSISALCSARILEKSATILLVKARGEIMQKTPAGAMAAIIGLEPDFIRQTCSRLSQPDSLAVAANENGPGQTVISGHQEAVARAGEFFRSQGAKAVIPLPTTCAFHSPLVAEAGQSFLKALVQTRFKDPAPGVSVIIDRQILKSGAAAQEKLFGHMVSPVYFTGTVDAMFELGAREFFEAGPGRVLSGLIKHQARARKIDDVTVFPIDDPKTRSLLGMKPR